MIETITVGRFKNYRKICEYLHEPIKTGKSKQLQLKDWKRYFEYERDGNAFVITKVYDAPKEKVRKAINDTSNYTSNNTKNIQSMIAYLQAKFDLDDNWYSFTDWYCEKLELMHKGICNAVYHPDEIDAVCEEYNISDSKLFCEYVSAAKSELKNMFLKALAYLDKKKKITYHDQYKFTYQLGKRTKGNVITDSLNEQIEENETTVCNDMNEDYKLSKKMKGRQLLKIIYSKEKLTKEFKELSLGMLQDDDYAINVLNCELSDQHPTFHPDYCSICKERPLISYYRGISITDMELEESDPECLALDITNRIRTKVRKSLMRSYRKPMKRADLQAIEKALFQQYYDKIDEDIILLADNNDASDIEQIFGGNDNWGNPVSMEHDFSVEEILDMPTEGEVQMNLPLVNTDCVGQNEVCKVESSNNFKTLKQDAISSKTDDININESHDNSSHGIFCVTGKDSDYIDIDDLY